jgi:hypothetical protein
MVPIPLILVCRKHSATVSVETGLTPAATSNVGSFGVSEGIGSRTLVGAQMASPLCGGDRARIESRDAS